MADRPIPFSAPMVRALLEGRKTQTRRVLKHGWAPPSRIVSLSGGPNAGLRVVPCAAGDRLYVREEHYQFGHWEPVPGVLTKGGKQKWRFVADKADVLFDPPKSFRKGRHHNDPATPAWHKRLARFMPKRFSRMTLIVTDVRVQRLQDISEADAIAEGATCRPACQGFMSRDMGWSMDWSKIGQPSKFARNCKALAECDIALGSAVSAFASFINEIHDPRWNYKGDGLFGQNPWVAALTFTVHHRNIDQMEGRDG